MKKQWQAKKPHEKVALAVGTLGSVCVIVLATLQLAGVWERAINLLEPLLGVVMLAQAVLQWNKNRAGALFSLFAAGFLFVVSLVILFF